MARNVRPQRPGLFSPPGRRNEWRFLFCGRVGEDLPVLHEVVNPRVNREEQANVEEDQRHWNVNRREANVVQQ